MSQSEGVKVERLDAIRGYLYAHGYTTVQGLADAVGASLATIRALPARPSGANGHALAASRLAFALCAGIAGTVPVGYWMIRMALAMSGNPRPHPWTHETDFPTPSNRRQACATPPSFVAPGSGKASSTPQRPIRY